MFHRFLSPRRRSSAVRWFTLAVINWILLFFVTIPPIWAGGAPLPTPTPAAPLPAAPPNTVPAAPNPAYELRTTLPNDDDTRAVAAGDLNGDGALDLVMGNWDSPNLYYLNDGQGNFDAGTPFGAARANQTAGVVLADLDDDGDLDIVASGADNLIYFNDGHAHFAHGGALGQGSFGALVVGDIDGDRDFDIVQATANQLQIWRNDGQGHFTGSAGLPGNFPHLVDFDHDGDLDLVVTQVVDEVKLQDALRFYSNDGAGGFTMLNELAITLPYGSANTAAFGDLDGDGQLDLLLSSSPRSIGSEVFDEGLLLYRQHTPTDHLLKAAPQWVNEFGGAWSIQIGDVNADGKLDIVAGGLFGHPDRADDQQGYLYLNQGIDPATNELKFRRLPWGTPTARGWEGVLLADVNGDGIDELIVANNGFDRIYANPSHPEFGACGELPVEERPVALLDLGGDGTLDLLYLMLNAYGGAEIPLLAARNDGAGNFRHGGETGIVLKQNDGGAPFCKP